MKRLALVLGTVVLSLGPRHLAQNPESSFAALKSLAGTWVGAVTTDPRNPDIEGPIQVTMRVASRGNVVMHEISIATKRPRHPRQPKRRRVKRAWSPALKTRVKVSDGFSGR